jgi:FkbM family methyltransferase
LTTKQLLSIGLNRFRFGLDPLSVFFIKLFLMGSKFIPNIRYREKMHRKLSQFKYDKLIKNMVSCYLKDGVFDFNGVLIPDISSDTGALTNLFWVYEDVLFLHCKHENNYSESFIDKIDTLISEGSYHIKTPQVDMTIKKGDVVIDIGAWIGDFSAYATHLGAQVYAFEPSPENLDILEKTSQLNGGFTIVPYGLANETGVGFALSHHAIFGQTKLVTTEAGNIKITTLDHFVRENKIQKIDFIKADIEGMEREMLKGATWTLKNLKPRLSLCTYHLEDDPEVLANLIITANPDYQIMQRKKKLFAWVPTSSTSNS